METRFFQQLLRAPISRGILLYFFVSIRRWQGRSSGLYGPAEKKLEDKYIGTRGGQVLLTPC